MSTDILKTPLNNVHKSLNARMVPFAGWEMPVQYQGILAEHHQTRERVSIFDTCHMGEFDIQGPHALADLEKLLTLNVATIQTGRCRYGFMLNEAGGVIDDLTCYRRGEDHFFLVVNAGTLVGDAAWVQAQLSPDTQFTDLSPTRAKLDVQGPEARAAVESALDAPLPELPYFGFADVELAGIPLTLSRTGYTGEWGYEFYFDAEQAETLWNKFTKGGVIQPAGLGARDTLRLEMGYALYGHELNDQRSPVATTRGMFISKIKEFIGVEQVRKELESGCPRYLCAIALEGKRAARENSIVRHKGSPVGKVSSGSLAPSLECAVAMAYVDAALTEPGQKLQIEVRGKPLEGEVVSLPFYKNGSARG